MSFDWDSLISNLNRVTDLSNQAGGKIDALLAMQNAPQVTRSVRGVPVPSQNPKLSQNIPTSNPMLPAMPPGDIPTQPVASLSVQQPSPFTTTPQQVQTQQSPSLSIDDIINMAVGAAPLLIPPIAKALATNATDAAVVNPIDSLMQRIATQFPINEPQGQLPSPPQVQQLPPPAKQLPPPPPEVVPAGKPRIKLKVPPESNTIEAGKPVNIRARGIDVSEVPVEEEITAQPVSNEREQSIAPKQEQSTETSVPKGTETKRISSQNSTRQLNSLRSKLTGKMDQKVMDVRFNGRGRDRVIEVFNKATGKTLKTYPTKEALMYFADEGGLMSLIKSVKPNVSKIAAKAVKK